MRRAIAALIMTLAASGCATKLMSEKECVAGDWFGAGLEDGAAGRLERAFDERAELCYGYGVDAAADYQSYRDGREDALSRLCTERGGYGYGRSGKSYLGVCMADEEPDFLGAYLEGWRVWRAEKDLERAQSAYNTAVSSVENYREDIRRARKVLHDKDATEKDVAKARKQLDRARDNLPGAESSVELYLYELGRADEALAQTMDGLRSWRRSDDFGFLLSRLLEAQAFARGEEAVDYCTDEFRDGYNQPQCEISGATPLRDRMTGAVCVAGPAKAVMLRRGPGYGPFAEAAFIGVYQVFSYDERGKTGRRPDSQFVAQYDGSGAYLGAACPSFDGAP